MRTHESLLNSPRCEIRQEAHGSYRSIRHSYQKSTWATFNFLWEFVTACTKIEYHCIFFHARPPKDPKQQTTVLSKSSQCKGPGALGKFLFILRKNLSPVALDKCAHWILDLPNFVKAYQTSKTPSSCLGAGQIFVRCEIWQMFIYTPSFEGKCQSRKILVGELKSEAR